MTSPIRTGIGPLAALSYAFRAALAWRLLLVWTIGIIVPTAVAVVPAWRVLASVFDRSPRAAEFAARLDMLAFEDVASAFVKSAAPVGGAAVLGTAVAALLWPLLAAITAGTIRADRARSLTVLLSNGVAWYGRMGRLWLVSLIPLMLFGIAAGLVFKAAKVHASDAILESDAKIGTRVAWIATVFVFVIVHATIEAGRAELAADENLRSAWRAWVRGVKLTARRPFSVIGLYLSAVLVSFVAAGGLLFIRLQITGANGAGFWSGFLLSQLAVAAVGWGRASRLLALTALARAGSTVGGAVEPAPRVAQAE